MGRHFLDLSMINQPACIRLLNGSFDALKLPLLEIEISRNRFIQKISPISVQRFGQSIKRIHFIGIDLEAD